MTSDPFNWNNVFILLLGVLAAWNTWRLEQRAKTAKEERETLHNVATKVEDVSTKVEIIHKETNSMKDALVTATSKAAKSEGKEEERVEERARVEEKAKQDE